MRAVLGVVLLWLLGGGSVAAQSGWAIEPGARFEIRQSYQTREQRGETGSGSSSGRSTMIERVVAVRDGGVELEYDTPEEVERRQWQVPFRVFKPANGPFELLNRAELEARVDPWLAKANWTRAICEQWIFTWNAFKIECEPQSALGIADEFNLWEDDLRAGAPFRMEGLLGTPPVVQLESENGLTVFEVLGTFDSAFLKRENAKAEVILAQFSGEIITQEQALERMARVQMSGTIGVRFLVTPNGLVMKRIEQTEFWTVEPDGEVEFRTGTTTTERRRLSPA